MLASFMVITTGLCLSLLAKTRTEILKMQILACQDSSSAVRSPKGILAMGRGVGWEETIYGAGEVGSCKLPRKMGTYLSSSFFS